ncbi:MAG: hypothetical protein IT572_02560 [Deltaproteobacteria bacterium]|nr:hypothetical protein [Deltaproteobacteria bacterium]
MVSAAPRRLRNVLFTLALFSLTACGGGQEDAPPAPVCPACPVCEATPTPSAEEAAQNLADKIIETEKLLRVPEGSLKASASKFGVVDKLGVKEISAEDFPRFVSLFWDIDAEFRIQYLRAMMTTNRVVDMMKPTVGKFDINIAPKDPEAEDVSLLVSQAIVDWAQVQRLLEDNFRRLGVENVMGVKPSDEMPHAETMMQELLVMVRPPAPTPMPTPGPQAASASLLSFLLHEAHAQGQTVIKGKTGTATAKISKAVPRVKVREAPLLLARVISYNVGGKIFVLHSLLMIAVPEFQAVPVEHFQFKLERMTIGPGYRDAVDAKVQTLAAKPKRDMVDWWNLSHGLIELRILNQLVDFSKVEAAPAAPGPSSGTGETLAPLGGAGTAPAGEGAQRPAQPSGAQAPDAAQPRPSTGQAAPAPSAPEARPSTATPGQAAAPQERPEVRPGSVSTTSPTERPSTELPKSVPAAEAPKAAPSTEVPKSGP